MGNEVRIKASVDDKVSTPLQSMEGKLESFGKKAGATIGGGSAIGKGVGLAAGALAFGAIGGAITAVTGFLGDSAEAYAADQRSIVQLNASLKANTEGFTGNTNAIEKVLASRISLGFSDDEQRDSLAKLVAATHDSTKALEIQRTAMDLARFKGISLAEASEALTKVEAGSFKVLKSLGIVLKDGATQQDALNAVQRVAMGQAEAYASTNEGKLLVSQVRVNEAQEKFGKSLSNLQAQLLPAAADAVEQLSYALDRTSIPLEKLQAAAGTSSYGAAAAFRHVEEVATEMGLSVEEAYALMGEAGSQNIDDLRRWRLYQTDTMGKGERAAWGLAAAVEGASEKSTAALKDVGRSADGAAHKLAEAIYGPAQLKGELAHLDSQLRTDIGHLHDLEKIKNPTAAQRSDIIETKGQIAATKGRTLELRVQMAQLNGQGLGALRAELTKLAQRTDAAGDQARELLGLLQAIGATPIRSIPRSKSNTQGRAAGGPVSGGTTYLVGEKGPELFTPGTSGGITANSALGGVGGGMTVNFNSTFPPTREQARDIVRALENAWADRMGYGRGNPTFVAS